MKKRLCSFLAAAAVILSVAGCAQTAEPVATTVSQESTSAEITSTTVSETEAATETEATTTEVTTAKTTTSTTIAETTTSATTAETTTSATTVETTTSATTAETTTSATEATTTKAQTTANTTVATTKKETTTAASTSSEAATTTEAVTTEKPAVSDTNLSEMTTMEIVRDMGIGINLGNTYESCGDWIKQWGDGTPESYETAWGSPVITEKIIKGYADAGFGVLRVPVAWSNMMADDYTISDEYAAAVKEVVDWALKYDLYVIVNLHYDNGWMENFPTDTENCMKKYSSIWEQVSEIFKDYDERLMFESQNEELGWLSLWNHYGGTTGKTESYALVNEINQKFVDIVRSSGGKNEKRHLLISGYNTDIEKTCDNMFRMPADPAGRCAVSVHYYTPSTFAILTEDADWGKAKSTWGDSSEVAELERNMDKLKTSFVNQGVPVIIGEYGCPTVNKDPESVRLFISSVCREAYERGMCPVLWSTTGEHYDRDNCKLIDEKLGEALSEITE